MPSNTLLKRARWLRAQGISPIHAARRLKREFPAAELLDIDISLGIGPTGKYGLWAELGHPIHPCMVRHDPRPDVAPTWPVVLGT